MQWSDIIKSNYLTKDFVGDEGTHLTIDKILNEKIRTNSGEAETKPVLYFRENVPPLILNKTNVRRLRHYFSQADGPGDLYGEVVCVYFDPTIEFAGKITGGLRIRPPADNSEQQG